MELYSGKCTYISVLMSVFNGEKWLTEAIDSVITQTFSDFEFIIINDGSSDSTGEILQNYKRSDPRIKIVDKSNTGLTKSLNIGLNKARGLWIARIDADDAWCRTKLEKQVEVLRNQPEIVLIGSGLSISEDIGQYKIRHNYPTSHIRLLSRLRDGRTFFPHSSAVFNLEKAREVGCYQENYKMAQDLDLWLRLSSTGKVSSIREPLTHIRKHKTQLSYQSKNFEQLIFSYMAMTSHQLREMGHEDPALNHKTQQKFFDFIKSSLFNSYKLKNVAAINQLKSKLSGFTSKKDKFFTLIAFIIKNPLVTLFHLKSKFVGTKQPQSFAIRWIDSNE